MKFAKSFIKSNNKNYKKLIIAEFKSIKGNIRKTVNP